MQFDVRVTRREFKSSKVGVFPLILKYALLFPKNIQGKVMSEGQVTEYWNFVFKN